MHEHFEAATTILPSISYRSSRSLRLFHRSSNRQSPHFTAAEEPQQPQNDDSNQTSEQPTADTILTTSCQMPTIIILPHQPISLILQINIYSPPQQLSFTIVATNSSSAAAASVVASSLLPPPHQL
mmetsp:Transcript_9841/g.13482  ORF Transcript_9841/g.13482 Transcript_9841/m.13482 type:complete len:126 (+) Transcript_9841:1238-1615(+)